MTLEDFVIFLCAGLVFAILIIISHEINGRNFLSKKWQNFKCKHNKHNFVHKRTKAATIRCQNCNKRKNTPHLKAIDGGNKFGSNKFKF